MILTYADLLPNPQQESELKYYFLKSFPIFNKKPLITAIIIIFKFSYRKRLIKKVKPLFLITLNKIIIKFAHDLKNGKS